MRTRRADALRVLVAATVFVSLCSVAGNSAPAADDAAGAARNLPASLKAKHGCYTPLYPLPVTIHVQPYFWVHVYLVEDQPPAGWTVSDINEAGTWDDAQKMVRWGPFLDNVPRTLTYNATPPADETGTKTFSGTVYFNGSTMVITGDSEVSLCDHEVTITTSSLADGVEGVWYSQTLQATSAFEPHTWSIVSGVLPPGLSVEGSTGVVSGTPSTVGTSGFTVQVTADSHLPPLVDQRMFSITIREDTAAGLWLEIPTGSATGGGVSASPGICTWPDITRDPAGNPVMCWTDWRMLEDEWQVHVVRWDGSGWFDMGVALSASPPGGERAEDAKFTLAAPAAIATDAAGNPIVSWSCWPTDEDSEIYVVRWDGSGWAEMGEGSATGGGISDNEGNSYFCDIATDSNGYPIVCWEDTSGGYYAVYVKRFNGTGWVEMGEGSASGGGIGGSGVVNAKSMLPMSPCPAIVTDPDGYPIIAWQDSVPVGMDFWASVIYVKKWNGTEWVEVGAGSASGHGVSDTTGMSGFPSIAVDASGNPIVSWQELPAGEVVYLKQAYDSEIYVKRFNGSEWVEMGEGSASGGGISDDATESEVPAITTDPAGNPIVTWQDGFIDGVIVGAKQPIEDHEVYVRRFDGSGWVEMGAGSATGGGISDDLDDSYVPAIASAFDGKPIVCWMSSSIEDAEIHVRRYAGSLQPALLVRVTGVVWSSDCRSVTVHYEANQPVTRYYYRLYQTESTYTGTGSTSAGFDDLGESSYLFIATARGPSGEFASKPCRAWFSNKPVGPDYQVSVASYSIDNEAIIFTLQANRDTHSYYVRLFGVDDTYVKSRTGVVTYTGLADGLYYFVATGKERATGEFPPGGPARQFVYIQTSGF